MATISDLIRQQMAQQMAQQSPLLGCAQAVAGDCNTYTTLALGGLAPGVPVTKEEYERNVQPEPNKLLLLLED